MQFWVSYGFQLNQEYLKYLLYVLWVLSINHYSSACEEFSNRGLLSSWG